jgi:glycosyltransferase domain-containing protein
MSLTIMLTLKDREDFTYRWMRYFNDSYCPYKILIADGGDNMELELHLRNHSNYPNLEYEYIRYPFDSTLSDFYAKIVDVFSRVETDYLLQADNDDFYNFDIIPDLIKWLDMNEDYVGARGELVNFEVFNRQGISKSQVCGNKYNAYLVKAPSIDSEDYLERIKNLCEGMSEYDYYSNWYSITRTDFLLKTWSQLVTLENKEVIVLEILSHVMMVQSGKIKIFHQPFYFRQSNTSTFGDTLVIGNSFLERCLYGNPLSIFSYAVDHFIKPESDKSRNQILASLAVWLEVFIVNIHRNSRVPSRGSRIKKAFKRLPFFGNLITQLSTRYKVLLGISTSGRILRLREIEPYILNSRKK